jgi:hypothetical protein
MNNFNAAVLFLTSLSLALTPSAARADSTNLFPIADTGLLESIPTNNLGGAANIVAGKTPKGRARGLFRFDLTQLPPGATVISATFTIQVVLRHSLPAPASNFTLHRVLKDWGEGVGQGNVGQVAGAGESSWEQRSFPGSPWTPAGGGAGIDYVAAGSATQFIDDVGSYTFDSTSTLVADLQAWVNNPAANFGWMLITDSEDTDFTSRRFATREDPTTPPVLSIQYTAGSQPPPPAPPVIGNLALVANQIRFSFNIESNRTYAVEFRPALDNSIWTSLTNIPAQPAAATISVTDPVSGTNRFYRVRTP